MKRYLDMGGGDVPYFWPKSGGDVPCVGGGDVPWIILMSPYSTDDLGTFGACQNLPLTHFLAKPKKAVS